MPNAKCDLLLRSNEQVGRVATQDTQQGDLEAAFKLLQVLWNATTKQGSQEQLARAEAFLRAAAAQRQAQALAIAGIWPRLKADAEQKFPGR